MSCMSELLARLTLAVEKLAASVGEEQTVATDLEYVRRHLEAHWGRQPGKLVACEYEEGT